MTDAVENWKDVPGFEGRYRVSDLGRVYSACIGRCLRLGTYPSGHKFVSLAYPSGGQKTFSVHGLVAKAFLGLAPAGQEVCHGPAGPGENAVRNLRYDTRGRNVQDRKWHGKHWKLSVEQVREIKRRLALGETHRHIAADFPHIHRNTVSVIAIGKIHADV